MGTQVVLEFARREPIAPDLLEEVAECCLDALHAQAQFVAFGPAVSVNFEKGAIEVECTIAADAKMQIERTVERISEVVYAAIAACEYSSSVTFEVVPA